MLSTRNPGLYKKGSFNKAAEVEEVRSWHSGLGLLELTHAIPEGPLGSEKR